MLDQLTVSKEVQILEVRNARASIVKFERTEVCLTLDRPLETHLNLGLHYFKESFVLFVEV